jgi:hypothetical protein
LPFYHKILSAYAKLPKSEQRIQNLTKLLAVKQSPPSYEPPSNHGMDVE